MTCIYCDWTSDSDFLKRELAGSYTELVLKHRVSSSQKILFIQTENSIKSDGGFPLSGLEWRLIMLMKLGKKYVVLILLITNLFLGQ